MGASAHSTRFHRSLKFAFDLDRLQIGRARLAPCIVLKVVGDALLLLERVHAGSLDGGNVDEGVAPPASLAMKPKPFVESKNFTVPIGMSISLVAQG